MTSRRAAFTLLEILVAVTILSAGILGVLGAFSLSLRAGVRAARVEDAARIGERQVQLGIVGPAEALRAQRGAEGAFAWQLDFEQAQEGLMLASVTVTWSEQGRGQKFRFSRVFLPARAAQAEEN